MEDEPENNELAEVKFVEKTEEEKAREEEEKVEEEKYKSWGELLNDFAQNSTFHGLRYFSEPTPFVLRKILWVLLVLSISALFIYICVIRAMTYYQYPSAVSVRIKYTNPLPFPAVTICNQNLLKASSTFKHGVYDRVKEGFEKVSSASASEPQNGKCEDGYKHYPTYYVTFLDLEEAFEYESMKTVSVGVCLEACTSMRPKCQGVSYQQAESSCWFNPPYHTLAHESAKQQLRDGWDYYERIWCKAYATQECSFDYGGYCNKTNTGDKKWRVLNGVPDHTTLSTNGRYIGVTLKPGQGNASVEDENFITSIRESCFSFYYQTEGNGTLQVNQIWPEVSKAPKTVWEGTVIEYSAGDGTQWERVSKRLEPGAFKIQFRAELVEGKFTARVDDIITGDCGRLCDDTLDDNNGCRADQFRCQSGKCMLQEYVCDGDNDCGDLSDENATSCKGYGVSCSFEKESRCGYIILADPGEQDDDESFVWKRNNAATPSMQTGPLTDNTHRLPQGYYMYAEATYGTLHSKTYLISPQYKSNAGVKYHTLEFHYHMKGELLGNLTVYQYKDGFDDMLELIGINGAVEGYTDVVIRLAASTSPFRIVFEATRGYGYRADIAIDDVVIRDSILQETAHGTKHNVDVDCMAVDNTCTQVYMPGLAARIRLSTKRDTDLKVFPSANVELRKDCKKYREQLSRFPSTTDYPLPRKPTRGINTSEELLKIASHNKTDMIYRCSFAGKPCSAQNFTSSFTDFGVCHTFNGDKGAALSSTREGAKSGLSLVVNIEEYEYMKGPTSDAGVKLLLHDRDSLSLVGDQGVAVAPGTHTLIQIARTEKTTLPRPWGDCGDKALKFYDHYRLDLCQRECQTNSTVKQCGCRAPYMPSIGGNPQVCSIDEYFECFLLKAGRSLSDSSGNRCECFETCSSKEYSQSLSYSALSRLSVKSILHSNPSSLENKFQGALQVQDRVTPDSIVEDIKSLAKMSDNLESFLSVLKSYQKGGELNAILTGIETIQKIFKSDLESTRNSVRSLKDLYNKFFLDQHLMLKSQHQSTIQLARTFIIKLSFFISGENRRFIDSIIESTSDFRTAASLFENIFARIAEALHVSTDPVKIQKLFNLDPNVTAYITDSLKLPKRMQREETKGCFQYEVKLNQDIRSMKHSLDDLKNYLKRFDQNNVNTTLLRTVYDKAIDFVIVYQDSDILGCLDWYSKELGNFDDKLGEYIKRSEQAGGEDISIFRANLDYDIEAIQESAGTGKQLIMKRRLAEMNKYKMCTFADPSSSADITSRVKEAVDHVKSKFTGQHRDMLYSHIDEMYSAYKEMGMDLVKMEDYFDEFIFDPLIKSWEIWKRKLPKDAKRFHLRDSVNSSLPFSYENCFYDTDQRRLPSKCLKEHIYAYFEHIIYQLDKIDKKLDAWYSEIDEALEQIKTKCNQYRLVSHLDENFVRKNFMVVDIFYPTLSFRQVDQIKALDYEELLSNIGGFMGLLLGASVITVFELLDLFIYNVFKRLIYRRNPNHRMVKRKNPTNGLPTTYKGVQL